jgi:hypothetical protein
MLKNFLSVIYELSHLLGCFTWQAFPAYSNKHSSLVQKLVNYGQKVL